MLGFWEYADGGTLRRFIDIAKQRDVLISQSFIIRFAVQALETLELMRTMPGGEMAHNDVHGDNVVLHFGLASNKIPDFKFIDFSHADRILTSEKRRWDLPGRPQAHGWRWLMDTTVTSVTRQTYII